MQLGRDQPPLARIGTLDGAARGLDRGARQILGLAVEDWKGRGLAIAARAIGQLDRGQQVARQILRAAGDSERRVQWYIERLNRQGAPEYF